MQADVDGVRFRTLTLKAKAAKAAKGEAGAKVGTLGRILVRLGEGPHKVLIYPTAEAASAAVRVLPGIGTKGGKQWVAFAPVNFSQAVRLGWKRLGPG